MGAKAASLTIMVGGRDEVFARLQPLLALMGKNITHVGPAGAGQITKVANQVIVALNIAAVAEALVFASKAGADPARVRQALMGGFASSRVLEVHGERMIKRTFNPGFRIKLHQKDLNLALQGATRTRRGAAEHRDDGATDAGLRRGRLGRTWTTRRWCRRWRAWRSTRWRVAAAIEPASTNSNESVLEPVRSG